MFTAELKLETISTMTMHLLPFILQDDGTGSGALYSGRMVGSRARAREGEYKATRLTYDVAAWVVEVSWTS